MSYFLVNSTGAVAEISASKTELQDLFKRGWAHASDEQVKKFKAKFRRHEAEPLRVADPAVTGIKEGLLDVFFMSPQASADGYGMVSNALIGELQEQGIHLNREYNGQQIAFVYHIPPMLAKVRSPFKILYTMFESSIMPQQWAEYFKMADLVLTPSKFCADMMRRQFKIKAQVIGHGYNQSVFKPIKRDTLNRKELTFLMYDAFKYRKGWDLAFKAFNQAFKPDDKVKLILKTTNKSTLPFHEYPNIEVIAGRLPQHELNHLLGRADVFVYPSRGEGYGLPPLEALATGLRVIAPHHTGMDQYLKHISNKIALPLEFQETKAYYDNPIYLNTDLGKYLSPTIQSIVNAMRVCYADWQGKDWPDAGRIVGSAKPFTMKKAAGEFAAVIKEFKENIKETPATAAEPKLSIVMLTHNALKFTKKAVASIKKHTTVPFELIVIDNASTDATPDWLKRQAGIRHLVLSKKNLGVAGGRNRGIKLARGHYIVFLDNDVEVGRFWDQRICETLDLNEDVWVVGKAGSNIRSHNPLIWDGLCPNTDRCDADVVAGFCFAFKAKIVPLIGDLFEPAFGTFWHEDMDFCARVKKYGKRVIRDQDINIIHHEHKSVAGGDVTPEQLKAKYSGFESKARAVWHRNLDDNVLTIFRIPKDSDHSSYSVICRNILPYLRDSGLVVLLKEHLHSQTKSFDLCKGFEMHYRGKRSIVLHLENDRPPKSWMDELKTVDYVWCSSEHTYRMLKLKKYGLAKKLINHSPDGFDANTYYWEVEPLNKLPFGRDGYFTFFNFGAQQPRKSTDLMIKAFVETFKPEDKVQLVLKNYDYGNQFWVKDLIEQHPDRAHQLITMYDDWGKNYLARVLKTVSRHGAYLSPHRGEGFGIPQLEAVACGMRLGSTNWGGCRYHFAGVPAASFFSYQLKPSTFHNNKDEQYYSKGENPQWAEPRLKDIKSWMRKMVREPYNERQAKLSSRAVSRQFSFETRAKKMVKILEDLK